MSRPALPLTDQAHAVLAAALRPGDLAIDATCGFGRDTLFLAQAVGSQGRVLAMDIQCVAVEKTRTALREAGFSGVADVLLRSHAELGQVVPAGWHGFVGAVTFNLGYLPGGDHGITTTWQETGPALMVATDLLRPGGVLTVIAYTGHPGGADEKEGVERELRLLDPEKWVLEVHQPEKGRRSPPWLYVVRRIGGSRPCHNAPPCRAS